MGDLVPRDDLRDRDRIDLADDDDRRTPGYSPRIAQPPPPMWNSGIATRFTESGRKPPAVLSPSIAVKRFLFVSITPLGRPVVPDE